MFINFKVGSQSNKFIHEGCTLADIFLAKHDIILRVAASSCREQVQWGSEVAALSVPQNNYSKFFLKISKENTFAGVTSIKLEIVGLKHY